ncbi:MAG: hypothetical protein LBP86_11195 [Azoarcus sp.]|jgi:protein TonB|nr:hypothetical protein [Azoarcus sp.]
MLDISITSTAKRFSWAGLALLLHGAFLFAMPHGAAQITLPKVVLAVSLIDAPVQAATPQPAAPLKAASPKPRTVPVQESRIQISGPFEAIESTLEPVPQITAAVSATPGNSTSTESNADAVESGPITAARFDAAYLHNPRPVYPAMSRLHEEGTVMLRAYVMPDGALARSKSNAVPAAPSWTKPRAPPLRNSVSNPPARVTTPLRPGYLFLLSGVSKNHEC